MASDTAPSIALLAHDAFVRPSGIARYQAELVTHLAGRTNLHLLIVHPSHVKAAHGALPAPMNEAHLLHYTAPSAVLRNAPAIARGFLAHPEFFDWNPMVFLNVVSSRLFTGAAIDRAGFDLVHGTSSYLPTTAGRTARVITVHDTTPLSMPERHTRNTVKCFVRPSEIRQDDEVIADTQSGLNEVLAVVDHPPENSHVVHLGIDRAVFHPPAPGTSPPRSPYILSVGTIEPRKNLVRALAAFELLRKDHKDLRWKLAGQRGWGWNEFARSIAASPARGSVDILGPVPDPELADLYRGALAFLFPTLWEGFGIPVLEALACGTPVAASKLPAIEEIGGGHFFPIEPESVESIAEATSRAAFDGNGREARRDASAAHAATFDWRSVAERTLDVYAKALGRPRDELLAASSAKQ